jgi:AraC-like DNA-binding protein
MVHSGSLPQLEALLGFPRWFREGTGLGPADTPFPEEIALADGMRAIANICAHGAMPQVLAAIIRAPQVIFSRGWGDGLALAPSLGDALARATKLFPVSNPYMRLRLECASGEAVVGVEIDAIVPDTIRPLSGTGALLLLYRLVQPYASGAMRECVLESAADGTPELMALQDLVEAQLRFGTKSYLLRFPEPWLTRENPNADAALWQLQINRMAGSRQISTPVTRAVSEAVRTCLEQGRKQPPLAEMAARLGLSERTLVRRLTEAGTSYSRLIDDARRATAARLIADPTIRLQQIADRLAYTDRQGFGRAFREWFGESPGRYRRRVIGAPRSGVIHPKIGV